MRWVINQENENSDVRIILAKSRTELFIVTNFNTRDIEFDIILYTIY